MARKRHRSSSQGKLSPYSTEQEEQQMEGAAMPLPPQNWPRNERKTTQASNSLRIDSQDIENTPDTLDEGMQQQDPLIVPPEIHKKDSSEDELQSKRTRGPTIMQSGWGKDGGILHVDMNDIDQLTGSEASILSSKLGVVARNGILTPLNYRDWRIVPKLYKDRIWAHIKEKTDATDDMRRMIMISIGNKWREWKHEAKMIGYEPYDNDIDRLGNRPDRVEEEQWRSLVHYWNTPKAKEKSKRNTESRKKLTMPHTSERRSHAQIIDQMTKENGKKPTRIQVFRKTHTRNEKPVNEKAGEVLNEMDEVAKVYPELDVPGGAPNDVYAVVMGPDTHGIVRTLGKGASPSIVYGPKYKRSQAEQRDFDARVEIEVQKATSTIRNEMEEKLSKAKEDMEENLEDRVKVEVQAYLESMGIVRSIGKSIVNEQVSANSNEDHLESSSNSTVRINKVNIVKKKARKDEASTKKRKWKF